MRVAGIICEYNPFHNGHLAHLEATRRASRCDFIVCVMSGDFVQRGEAAITDKFLRARMALTCGADVVVELPVDLALAPARDFATGAAAILEGLGVITHISFGSESGDAALLKRRAEIINNEPEGAARMVKELMARGVSQPKALSVAQSALLETGQDFYLDSPNDVLASEYIAALWRIGSAIEPIAVIREEHHNSPDMGRVMSAGAIRASVKRRGLESVTAALPASSQALLEEAFTQGRGPVFTENFDMLAIAALREKGASDRLAGYPGVGEGLERRIISAARETGSIEELIGLVKTKRYTRARIARIIMRFMLGLDALAAPPYARILGFRRDAGPLLKDIKRSSRIPVIVKAADCGEAIREAFGRTVRAGDIYALVLPPPFTRAGRDYTEGIIII